MSHVWQCACIMTRKPADQVLHIGGGGGKIYRTVRESATIQNVYMIDKEHAHLMAKHAVGHQI